MNFDAENEAPLQGWGVEKWNSWGDAPGYDDLGLRPTTPFSPTACAKVHPGC
jgi:hypothetical protein